MERQGKTLERFVVATLAAASLTLIVVICCWGVYHKTTQSGPQYITVR